MNEFEIACNEVDGDSNSPECVIEWLRNNKTATVTFPNNTRFKTKIIKLAEQFPNEVQIRHVNKDGSIIAHIPVSYIKINRSKIELTEEQKKERAERLRKNMSRNTNDLLTEDTKTGF